MWETAGSHRLEVASFGDGIERGSTAKALGATFVLVVRGGNGGGSEYLRHRTWSVRGVCSNGRVADVVLKERR